MSARKLPTDKMLRLIDIGDVEGVRALLDVHPALIRADLTSGDQPLNIAAWQGRMSIARLLIRRGADLNHPGSNGRRPLHYAAMHNQHEIAALLLDKGADIEGGDCEGWTPLFVASRSGTDGDAVAALLESRGAHIDLNTAVCLYKTDWIRKHLSENPRAVAEARHPEFLVDDMLLLINWRISSEANSGKNRKKAQRIVDENRPLLEVFLREGARLPDPEHCLQHAILLPDTSIARLLLEYGADPTVYLQYEKRNMSKPMVALLDEFARKKRGRKKR